MSSSALFDLRTRAVILALGFASGLPADLLQGTFQARMVDAGLKPGEIGLLSLITLPAMLKVLWAPLVDRWNPGLGRRRGWMLIALLVMAPAVALIGAWNPAADLTLVVSVAVNGYTCDVVDARSASAGAGLSVWGYRAAAVASSFGALWLVGAVGWTWSYYLMGLAVALCIPVVLLAREPEPRGQQPVTLVEAVITPLRAFRNDLGVLGLVLVLAFALLFRLADQWAGNQTTAFLRTEGFDNAAIGLARGPVGLVAAGVGVLAAGWIGARLTVGRCLLIAGLLGAASNLIFIAIDREWLVGTVGLNTAMCVESSCGGFMSAIFVGFLVRLCSSSCAATQYALLTAVWLLGRFLTAPAGYIAEIQGWTSFFMWSAAAGIPGLLLIPLVARREQPGKTTPVT